MWPGQCIRTTLGAWGPAATAFGDEDVDPPRGLPGPACIAPSDHPLPAPAPPWPQCLPAASPPPRVLCHSIVPCELQARTWGNGKQAHRQSRGRIERCLWPSPHTGAVAHSLCPCFAGGRHQRVHVAPLADVAVQQQLGRHVGQRALQQRQSAPSKTQHMPSATRPRQGAVTQAYSSAFAAVGGRRQCHGQHVRGICLMPCRSWAHGINVCGHAHCEPAATPASHDCPRSKRGQHHR
jgi:hypothetical protein